MKFESVSDAEEEYNINYFDESDMVNIPHSTTSTPIQQGSERVRSAESPMLAFSPLRRTEERKLPGSVIDVVTSGFVTDKKTEAAADCASFPQMACLGCSYRIGQQFCAR